VVGAAAAAQAAGWPDNQPRTRGGSDSETSKEQPGGSTIVEDDAGMTPADAEPLQGLVMVGSPNPGTSGRTSFRRPPVSTLETPAAQIEGLRHAVVRNASGSHSSGPRSASLALAGERNIPQRP
jgi:hypothetical protein